jgi:hypothetical protein
MRRDILLLPERDKDLYHWARRSASLFDRGPRAAFLNATSRQRYVGSGDLAGLSDVGRLRDFRFSRSQLRGQNVYRYREISPERQVIVLADLRDVASNYESRCLVSCAVAAAVLVAIIPETKLTWAAFGADRAIPPVHIESTRPAYLLRGAAQAMLRFGRDPHGRSLGKQEGAIRRVLAFAPDAHLILVSHYLEPKLFHRLPFVYGATVFLVEAGADGWRNPRGGVSLNALAVPGLTGALNLRLQDSARALQSRRAHCLTVRTDGDLLKAITESLGRRRRGS